MQTPVRLRAWHDPIVEDADGMYICTAATVYTAKQIVVAINAAEAIGAIAPFPMEEGEDEVPD